MPDLKISQLTAFTGDIQPSDLSVIVDVSAGPAGTKKIAHSGKVYPYIVLRSTGPDAHKWKITVNDTGQIDTEDLGV